MQAGPGKSWCLLTLVVSSVLIAVYQGVAYRFNVEPSRGILTVWALVFPFLVVLWINADSQAHPQIYRPFEYGYLVLFIWFAYVPYYLCRTRGVRGLMMLGGLVALYLLGYVLRWALYLSR